jgi:hypothetical protein
MRRAGAVLAVLLAGTACAETPAGWTIAAVPAPGVAAAKFEEPADVYPHRIMGDIREKLVLAVRDGQGREHRVDLRVQPPGRHVFEDTAPRVVDADGDGVSDVVVVETDPQAGAQLAIYGLRRGRLTKIAATPFIGRPFRWLAPVAAADLDGNGIVEIAYVETPHLGRILRVWTWSPGGLTEIAALPGVTNHRIGDAYISGGLRACGDGPELVLANAGWTQVLAVRFDGTALHAREIGPLEGPESFAAARACR